MKTLNILKLTVAALLLVAANSFAQTSGSIVNSGHNFQGQYNTTEICIVCHAAHNNSSTAGELLWNHEESTAVYTVYSSPTFGQTAANPPSGSSKLCLSCHDGTVAVDSFGGATGSAFIDPEYNLGQDLSNDHPISFSYSTANEELHPVSGGVTFGDGTTGVISDILFGGMVECSSCHDVHNTKSGDNNALLLVNNTGSALCLTCHSK